MMAFGRVSNTRGLDLVHHCVCRRREGVSKRGGAIMLSITAITKFAVSSNACKLTKSTSFEATRSLHFFDLWLASWPKLADSNKPYMGLNCIWWRNVARELHICEDLQFVFIRSSHSSSLVPTPARLLRDHSHRMRCLARFMISPRLLSKATHLREKRQCIYNVFTQYGIHTTCS